MTHPNKIPRVSIIVPVRNDVGGISATLRSLLGQFDAPTHEIIVVDNNSQDETAATIHNFPVTYLLQSSEGSYAARNLGIAQAKGEILAFIDSGCTADPYWLKNGLACLSHAAAVGGRIEFTFSSSRPNVYEYLDSSRKLKQDHYVRNGFAATANFFVRRKIIDKYGPFRGELRSGGDYEFGRRITSRGEKLIYCHKAYVFHPARTTLSSLVKKTIRVALGQKQLQAAGLLDHHRTSLASWLPFISLPPSPHLQHFSFPSRLYLVGLNNVLKYLNLAIRLWPWS